MNINNIYILIFILSLTYIFYYIFNKILLKHFSVKEIIVHTYILSAIIVLILFNNEFFVTIKKIDKNYIFLILLAITIVLSNALLTYCCTKDINFGIIEGIAMGIYIPLVAIISYYFFNNKINIYNFIGLLLIGFGVYLSSK